MLPKRQSQKISLRVLLASHQFPAPIKMKAAQIKESQRTNRKEPCGTAFDEDSAKAMHHS